MKLIFSIVLIFIFQCSSELISSDEIFIRLNQIGFQENETKTAVVLSKRNLNNKKFFIISVKNNSKVFEGKLEKSYSSYGKFNFTYQVDFSKFTTFGFYKLQLDNQFSSTFEIGNPSYDKITSTLLDFFKVQRCGYTSPILHKECHIADATSIILGDKVIDEKIDLTGGWHDAGDYIKFLNTTAFSTYMLIFAYEFDPVKFGFDNDSNGAPDILEEAKIGLDWLIRCNYQNKLLVTQVQDLRDHDVGWRMPENDTLRFDRPAFLGIGKNLIGIYVSALSIGARVWRDKFYMNNFSDLCLTTAENFYSIRNSVPDVDSSGTGAYLDKSSNGKLALAAIEMYKTTNRKIFLDQAKFYADKAGADYWWSYGDISSLAHYRLSQYDQKYADYLKISLEHYKLNYKKMLFGNGTPFIWGTNNTLLGIALKNILYKKLTNDFSYDTLAISQRDYVLGKNPWGICFIGGFGNRSASNFHHQFTKFKGKLPGGFAAGPVDKKIFSEYKIQIENSSYFVNFENENAVYYDDKNDYVTNEPTIIANATAIFVFGNSIIKN